MTGSAACPPALDARAFAELRASGRAYAVLDVREPWELAICGFAGAINVPLAELAGRTRALPRDVPLVVVCHHGRRSRYATDFLRENGLVNATNLDGGVDAWALAVDGGMARY